MHPCITALSTLLQDFDHTALLARETVQDGHSVLIFCGTKAACETTAKRAARWGSAAVARTLPGMQGFGWAGWAVHGNVRLRMGYSVCTLPCLPPLLRPPADRRCSSAFAPTCVSPSGPLQDD